MQGKLQETEWEIDIITAHLPPLLSAHSVFALAVSASLFLASEAPFDMNWKETVRNF